MPRNNARQPHQRGGGKARMARTNTIKVKLGHGAHRTSASINISGIPKITYSDGKTHCMTSQQMPDGSLWLSTNRLPSTTGIQVDRDEAIAFAKGILAQYGAGADI